MSFEKLILAVVAFAAAGSVVAEIPRPEHPRPQFVREAWINLNGDSWTYQFDFGESGCDAGRELFKSTGFENRIVVPFCPESSLSGVGYKDLIPAMWYHRKLAIPSDWRGKKILLRFGAVDYESEIYLDGKSIGFHFGGTSSFAVDLTPYAKAGATHDLVVRVKDETRGDSGQPRGKQSQLFKSAGCHYTRTTGIWQTVWLEAIDVAGLADCQTVADFDGGRFVFTPTTFGEEVAGARLRITVMEKDGPVAARTEAPLASGVAVPVTLPNPHAWSPEDPYLYDVIFEVVDATGVVRDRVKSYAGFRKIACRDGKVYLNNKPVFLRFVLDQGFYPDGIWTAPSDAALKRDIELSMAVGFNGARLHQKVFEERFHYWADRLGYLTWGESSSWGMGNDARSARNFLPEWREIVVRDRNHPSIIAWTPFNETYFFDSLIAHQRFQNDVYDLTKALDPTRPVNTASGDLHSKTDLWTVHSYARAPELAQVGFKDGDEPWCSKKDWIDTVYHRYQGQPYLVDEFGGLAWVPPERRAADNTWGYGNAIKTEQEFFEILKGEVDVLLGIPKVCGFCYTQLTDIEQEQNGVYYYDRTPKFPQEKFKKIFTAQRQ